MSDTPQYCVTTVALFLASCFPPEDIERVAGEITKWEAELEAFAALTDGGYKASAVGEALRSLIERGGHG